MHLRLAVSIAGKGQIRIITMISLFLRAKFEFVTSFFGIHTRYNQFNYLWCIGIALKNIAFKANGSFDIIDYNFSSFKYIVRKIAQDLQSIINRKSNSYEWSLLRWVYSRISWKLRVEHCTTCWQFQWQFLGICFPLVDCLIQWQVICKFRILMD